MNPIDKLISELTVYDKSVLKLIRLAEIYREMCFQYAGDGSRESGKIDQEATKLMGEKK